MLQPNFLKPSLSIKKLTKKHFWIGILFGCLVAFLISYATNYGRELLRSITFLDNRDPFILSDAQFFIYDLTIEN